MSKTEYLNQYAEIPTEKLKSTLACLKPNPHTKPERLEVLEEVLKNRECTSDKSFDERVADYYLMKVVSARDRGIPFDLTVIDVRRLMSRKTCFYTGARFNDFGAPEKNGLNWTIDRKDSTKGYTKDNCVACCSLANNLKNIIFEQEGSGYRLTPAQFRRFAKVMGEI